MKKIILVIIKSFLISLVPILFTTLGSTDFLAYLQTNKYLGENINITAFKSISNILGIVTTFLFLTLNIIINEFKCKKLKKQLEQLIKFNKNILISALSKHVNLEYFDLNIRIFIINKRLLNRFSFFKKDRPIWFKIKNVDGLAEKGITDNLKFQVYPENKKQGLVGTCYNERKILIDDNLKNTNDLLYNLDEYQKSKTKDLKLVIACPIFNSNKKIEAIVTYDSKNQLEISDKTSITNLLYNFTQQLYEYVPEFFQ